MILVGGTRVVAELEHEDDGPAAAFYASLVDLFSSTHEPERLLDEAIGYLVTATSAQLVFVELHGEPGELVTKLQGGTGADHAALERQRSKRLMATAMKEGRTIATTAIDDARFADLDSVRRNEIGCVIVAPVGAKPCKGAAYLQARGGQTFSIRERAFIERFASVLEAVRADVLEGHRIATALRRNGGNVAAAARELNIARSHLYERMRKLHIGQDR